MNVQFDYSVGQQVKVKAVEMLGRVGSLSFDNNGKMYRVVYWNDGSRCQVWMYDWEIEPCGTKSANSALCVKAIEKKKEVSVER